MKKKIDADIESGKEVKQKAGKKPKKNRLFVVLAVLAAVCILAECAPSSTSETPESDEYIDSVADIPEEEEDVTDTLEETDDVTDAPAEEEAVLEAVEETVSLEEYLSAIPAYSGTPYAEVNANIPLFTEYELVVSEMESYSSLDALQRCGVAYACIGTELMPTTESESIGAVRPSGWHTIKYDVVDGNYLYNRCHLIGFQLAGETANEENLITGTRYMNVQGMLPFENQVADYVKDTGNHVLYRVTPVFTGDNLVADGVLMEAKSVEDEGAGICFHVYCYNVQPGVVIEYADGSSRLAEEPAVAEEPVITEAPTVAEKPVVTDAPAEVDAPVVTEAPVIAEESVVADEPAAVEEPVITEAPAVVEETGSSGQGAYVVNGKNGKIHMNGDCAATKPGSASFMTQPVYFDTYEDAEAYSIALEPGLEKRKCGNCW